MTTRIEVRIRPHYIEDRSEPDHGLFAFAYTVSLLNQGDQPATLRRRHWRVTDGNNQVQEVDGEGVIGQQPRLGPGQSFEYTSGVQLLTPWGSMEGYYQFETDDGHPFDVAIPLFDLISPRGLH